MIELRDERPVDAAAIREVHIKAFGGPLEAKLVELLRERHKALVALVAIKDEKVAGHILLSKVTIAHAPDSFNAVGLAPVAVHPDFQHLGIGSMLINEGLARCKQAGCDAVVVLGDPAYYRRFGFLRAAQFGLENEYGAGNEFMILALRSGALEGIKGMVKYAPEFQEAGC